jgi:hypothetical protein
MELTSIVRLVSVRPLAPVLRGHAGVTRARLDARIGFGTAHFTLMHGSLQMCKGSSEATCFGELGPTANMGRDESTTTL